MRRETQRGAALVESALVMTLFLSMVVGAVYMANFLHTRHSLSEEVRAAAREGAVKGLTEDRIRTLLLARSAVHGLKRDEIEVRVLDPGTPDHRVVVRVRGVRMGSPAEQP